MDYYKRGEKQILEYFFTNLDRPIFLVKNLPPEVWALLQARYSRSKKGLREDFLDLLKEDPKNFESLKRALKNKSEVNIENLVKKAMQFMDKWVLNYGHASVAEGAVVGIGLENISILATKVIEDNRLASYIEKSTRYVSFDKNSFYLDPILMASKFGEEIKNLFDLLFKTYMDFHEPVLEHIKKEVPLKGPEKAWERACAARRFDAVRYLLPTSTKTSLGWTVNARNLERAITKLLSHPLTEMRDIGLMLKTEAQKILPSLLKYADKNQYLAETNEDARKLANKDKSSDEKRVTLVDAPFDLDEKLITAVLYRYSTKSYQQILEEVKVMDDKQKEGIYDTYLKKMGPHDWPMRELEHAEFTWEIVIDYGAFRDLQRHRICTQTNQNLTTFLGYDTPEDIINAGLKDKYDKVMSKATNLFERVYDKYPMEAQYIVPLAYRKRFLLTANLREMYYLIKLRSKPQGHFSYRKVAKDMYEILKEKYPLASKYIICHEGEELGRLKMEQKIE